MSVEREREREREDESCVCVCVCVTDVVPGSGCRSVTTVGTIGAAATDSHQQRLIIHMMLNMQQKCHKSFKGEALILRQIN